MLASEGKFAATHVAADRNQQAHPFRSRYRRQKAAWREQCAQRDLLWEERLDQLWLGVNPFEPVTGWALLEESMELNWRKTVKTKERRVLSRMSRAQPSDRFRHWLESGS